MCIIYCYARALIGSLKSKPIGWLQAKLCHTPQIGEKWEENSRFAGPKAKRLPRKVPGTIHYVLLRHRAEFPVNRNSAAATKRK